jgi:hypothetical protein
MQLLPNNPPGRANRKALRFSDDIRRLRAAGYTFSAIRLALRDAGIDVSLTTLKREAARQESEGRIPQRIDTEPQRPAAPAARAGVAVPLVSSARGTTGRDIAEAFFQAHPSNPLFPTQETP